MILWQMHSVNGGPSDLCVGEVTSFDMKQTRVRVLFYKDGKFEWLSLEEAIDIATTPGARHWKYPLFVIADNINNTRIQIFELFFLFDKKESVLKNGSLMLPIKVCAER